MKTITFIAAVAVVGTTAAALAHGSATGVVKERMDAMMAMGEAVKKVTPMMTGEKPYEADTLRETARIFGMHSGEAMTKLFPEGTGGKPSEAKDAVWKDWATFQLLADQLGEYAKGLEAAAGNGVAMAGSAAMGGNTTMGSGSMMGGSMMGSANMMGGGAGMMTADAIAAMPADGAFAMTTQVCSACHSQFRAEEK